MQLVADMLDIQSVMGMVALCLCTPVISDSQHDRQASVPSCWPTAMMRFVTLTLHCV